MAGVTTLIDMPLNSLPPTLTAKSLAAKKVAARGRCRVDVGFWGGSVPTSLDDLPEMFAAGCSASNASCRIPASRSSRR